MENNKLKELAQEFFDKCITFQRVDDQIKAFRVESLYKFLVDNQWKIADNYDKDCHKEDIICELEERGYDVSKISNKLIDDILYYFEDKLGDYGSECGWRTILDNVIEWYEEDLEEYKLEESE